MELALRNKLILKVTARGFEKSVSRKKTSLASYGYSNLERKFCKLQVLSIKSHNSWFYTTNSTLDIKNSRKTMAGTGKYRTTRRNLK